MASPSIKTEQTPINASPNQKNESKGSSVSPDIPHLEHLFRVLTNWNLGLLIVGGAIALAIGGLSVAIDRVGGQLFDAKEAEGKTKQLELAKAQKEAADAQLSLKKASAFAAEPRRIIMGSRNGDDSRRAERFKELEKYSDTPTIIVFVRDEEAELLANDIHSALIKSGWKHVSIIDRAATPIPLGFIQSGVQVRNFMRVDNAPYAASPPPNAKPPAVVEALLNLLNMDLGQDAAGTPFGVIWQPDAIVNGQPFGIIRYGFKFPENGLVITVGRKPTEQIFMFLPNPAPAEPTK
ncbi:MAG TPA: hypothetical protein VGK24_02435 [Candidatus Angelobacter sp.]|jgi:hypothetical protein